MNLEVEFCQSCHLGTVELRLSTYAAWHTRSGSEGDGDAGHIFIVAPGVPVWVCPVCGARVFEQNTIERLILLAGPPASSLGDEVLPISKRRARVALRGDDSHLLTQ